MNVLYKSDRLKNSVEIKRKRDKEYGNLSDYVKMRVDMLKTVQNVSEVSHLPPINRHKLKGDRKDEFAIDIKGRRNKNRIVFVPVGRYESEDLSTIITVMITFVGNYH